MYPCEKIRPSMGFPRGASDSISEPVYYSIKMQQSEQFSDSAPARPDPGRNRPVHHPGGIPPLHSDAHIAVGTVIRWQQVRERGRVGQGGEDGFDDHGRFGIEVGVQTESTRVALAANDAVDSMDELVPAWIGCSASERHRDSLVRAESWAAIKVARISGRCFCSSCRVPAKLRLASRASRRCSRASA